MKFRFYGSCGHIDEGEMSDKEAKIYIEMNCEIIEGVLQIHPDRYFSCEKCTMEHMNGEFKTKSEMM